MQHAKKMVLVDPKLLQEPPPIVNPKEESLKYLNEGMKRTLSSEETSDYEKARDLNQLLFRFLKRMEDYLQPPYQKQQRYRLNDIEDAYKKEPTEELRTTSPVKREKEEHREKLESPLKETPAHSRRLTRSRKRERSYYRKKKTEWENLP